MKFLRKILKPIILVFILDNLNLALAQDCQYSLNIYARTVSYRNYGGNAYQYIKSNHAYPNEKYIPSYGSFNFGGYDSVVLFYAANIVYDKSLFDISKYTANDKNLNKKGMVRAIIKDNCTSKEVWIMHNYTVLIDDKLYDMTEELINFLGKYMPSTLRENWEIHYNYIDNYFYIGAYQSPIKVIVVPKG